MEPLRVMLGVPSAACRVQFVRLIELDVLL